MNSRRLPILFCLLLAGMGWLACGPARADDDARARGGSAVEQLQPAEIAELRKKIPTWDELDARRREHIARRVLWLRGLSAAEREKLGERLRHLQDRRGDGPRDGLRVAHMVAGKAVGQRVWNALPEATRAVLVQAGLRPSLAQMVLFRTLLGHAARLETEAAAKAPAEAFPRAYRERAAHLQQELAGNALDEGGVRKARARLADLLVKGRVESMMRELMQAGGTDRRAAAEQLGAKVIAAWPQALEQTLKDAQEHPERVVQWARKQRDGSRGGPSRPMGRGPLQRSDWMQLALQIERAAQTAWKDTPELLRHADALLRTILVSGLGVDEAAVDGLPPRSEARERARALFGLFPGLRGRDGARPGPRGFPGGRRPR